MSAEGDSNDLQSVGCRSEISSWRGQRGLEWTAPKLGGGSDDLQSVGCKSEITSWRGRSGLAWTAPELEGSRMICNHKPEGAKEARTMWKDGAVMWVGWPEMQRPSQL